MTPHQFVSELSSLRFENTFNPYVDHCPTYDYDGAPEQRFHLLTQILDAATRCEIDSIWVGRDLGHRGGRRTGLALTDDIHFHDHSMRWGTSIDRPTKGQPVAEKTATEIWNLLDRIDRPVFLWNVFPLHPHKSGEPFTNRLHIAKERRSGVEILRQLMSMLRPKRLIGIGNDADHVLRSISGGTNCVKVRHPSYGGQAQFSRQIRELYDIQERTLL